MADMQSNIIARIKKEDREYLFVMPQGAPCGEAYDACFEVLNEIVKMADRLALQAKNIRQPVDSECAQEVPTEQS